MKDFTADSGLLQIADEELSKVIKPEPIQEVYDVDKTPLGR